MLAPMLVLLHVAMFPNSSRAMDYLLLSHSRAQPFCHVRQSRKRSWLNSCPQLRTDTAHSSSATSVQSKPMNLGRNLLLWKALGEICQALGLKRAAAATVLFPGGSLLTQVGFWSHHCVTQRLPSAPLLDRRERGSHLSCNNRPGHALDTRRPQPCAHSENRYLGFIHPE